MTREELLAELRLVSFKIDPCKFCVGRRVLHGGILVQIEHDNACPAKGAAMGTPWNNAPQEVL
jgi:hypothetical protein